MKDIYTLTPINKTSALVVNQSGCTSHEGLSLEQQKANLCAKWHSLEDKIMYLPKNSNERKAYGRQIAEIHKQIIVINEKLKVKKRGELTDYIIKIIKRRMTKDAWNRLLDEAEKERSANLK